ncbi:AsnC family transcriptional regulator [Nonomuraea phyllanthi]|uniref:AsnC family transcriptional regulator n=1 Tax=Nonomuraea phyllanthi TaxID=2219224 RepID=A0A5C4WTX0_9ACTN|nr:Lrp/AsnC family transcriptional regulator [Nonomuraea phyllanthi]KAB8197049.1 AsnC family transcriptional regulator [Nonomuraea phyllanthi]QFY06950.1 AsnC family transcriptional regulator [Nonomuraea phyllanthi]
MTTPPRVRRTNAGSGTVVLDDLSKQIIEQLQRDGRMPYAAIGKAVGLSEAAVRQRVQRLQDAGVMQIVAVTDPLTLGFPRQAMIGINIEGDLEAVADELAAIDEIDYVVLTAGSFDVIVEVVCEGDGHLLDILSKIRAIAAVRATESFVYLKLRKQTYSWGTR